ncbi:MAG: ATP synthase F1 subunit delta [Chloroflexaceae bacterium]
MTTSEADTYARALYESVISMVVKQLRTATPKLEDVNPEEDDLNKRVRSASPTGTPPEVRNFLTMVINEGMFDRLPEVIEAFERYSGVREEVSLPAEIISAIPLSDEQQQHITDELQQRYEQTLRFRFTVDESLIGGLIIRVGDQVLDNSLRVRLNEIQRNMLAT